MLILCGDKEEEEKTNVEKGLKGGKRKSRGKTKTSLAYEDGHVRCVIHRRCFSGGGIGN